MKSLLERWSKADIEALFGKQEEGQYIDYKSSGALSESSWKCEFCRDVSAFANGDGGVLIYGVTEEKQIEDKKQKIYPQDFDEGIDTKKITKERLVDILNGGIQRPTVFYVDMIPLSQDGLRVAYVIRVPRSVNGPHQVISEGKHQYRYYQRQETSNNPMQDWQIRDVRNREDGPDLSISLTLVEPPPGSEGAEARGKKLVYFEMPILNKAVTSAKHVILILYIDKQLGSLSRFDGIQPIEYGQIENIFPQKEQGDAYKYHLQFTPPIPIFQGFPFHWKLSANSSKTLSLGAYTQNSDFQGYLKWELYADKMLPRYGLEKFTFTSSKVWAHQQLEQDYIQES